MARRRPYITIERSNRRVAERVAERVGVIGIGVEVLDLGGRLRVLVRAAVQDRDPVAPVDEPLHERHPGGARAPDDEHAFGCRSSPQCASRLPATRSGARSRLPDGTGCAEGAVVEGSAPVTDDRVRRPSLALLALEGPRAVGELGLLAGFQPLLRQAPRGRRPSGAGAARAAGRRSVDARRCGTSCGGSATTSTGGASAATCRPSGSRSGLAARVEELRRSARRPAASASSAGASAASTPGRSRWSSPARSARSSRSAARSPTRPARRAIPAR